MHTSVFIMIIFCVYRCFEMFKIIHTIVDTEEALTMVQRSSSYIIITCQNECF